MILCIKLRGHLFLGFTGSYQFRNINSYSESSPHLAIMADPCMLRALNPCVFAIMPLLMLRQILNTTARSHNLLLNQPSISCMFIAEKISI